MKNKSIITFLLICLGFSISTAKNPPQKRTIYAGTISNVNYVVGARNLGTGLFTISDDGSKVEKISNVNLRTFSVESFPDHENGLIYCDNGNGLFVTKNHGKKWRVTTGWEITEVLEAAAVTTNPKIIYIGSAYGLYISTEYGENFKRLTNRFVGGLKIDNKNLDRIYLGQEDGLYISNNSGKTFKKVAKLAYQITTIAQDPKDQNRIYIGTEDDGIFISENRGKSWQQVSGEAIKATVYEITIDDNNPDRLFAASFKMGVLRSMDRGKSWQSFTKGLEEIPVYGVVIHPDRPDILYAGTANKGVRQSKDNGQSWQDFALDGSHVFDIEIK